MYAILSPIRQLLNALLPFTNPNTPLLQDLIHTLVLCGTLYFAPQFVELYKTRHAPTDPPNEAPPDTYDVAEVPANDMPIDESLVIQPDTEDDDTEPRPQAPTPPLGQPFLPPEAQQQEHQHFEPPLDGDAGPANFDRPRPTAANRTVGAKKAKSLARKDQRRAYHEFHRQQAELRRQEEAKDAPIREAAMAAEKARRLEAEREIQERERLEREKRRKLEQRAQEEERERRERTLNAVRETLDLSGAVNLEDLAWKEGKDTLWIERLVRASGLLSQNSKESPGTHSMITAEGWLVKIDEQLMQKAYAEAVAFGEEHNGLVSFSNMGSILERAVQARARA